MSIFKKADKTIAAVQKEIDERRKGATDLSKKRAERDANQKRGGSR